MEWVETTGRTVEEALDGALDELGVDNDEVEYEVLEEPRGGLRRREARIRARVKPVSREKPGEGRRRSGRREQGRGESRGSRGGSGGGSRPATATSESVDGARPASRRRRRGGRGRGTGTSRSGSGEGREERPARSRGEDTMDQEIDEVSLEEQRASAGEFTRGIVDAFELGATVDATIVDEGVLVDVTGDDVGLLLGPKGATLQAIEELVRTAVQRQTEGRGARINVDVGGYRAKRRAALGNFAREVAEKVRESGEDQSLEPMSASDRKVVHDALAELDGIETVSEGEDPRRRVVIHRA